MKRDVTFLQTLEIERFNPKFSPYLIVVVDDDGCVPSPATSGDSDIGGLPRPGKGRGTVGACGIWVHEGLIEIVITRGATAGNDGFCANISGEHRSCQRDTEGGG